MTLLNRSFVLCSFFAWCYLSFDSALASAQWQHKIIGPTSLAFSPDSRWLAVGSIEDWVMPGDLQVWETLSGKLLHKERYIYGINALAFSPDGRTLAVATSTDNPIRLWSIRSWHVDHTLGERQYINSIAYSHNGKQLIAGNNMGENGETDNTYLWDIQKRRSHRLTHSDGLSQMLFAPRTGLILGGFYSGYNNDDSEALRAWDATGHFLWQHPQPGLRDIAFLPDGRTFIAGIGKLENDRKQSGSALQIWNAAKGRLIQTIKRSEDVSAVAVAHDGKTWASGDASGNVHLWDAQSHRVIKSLRLHKGGIIKLAFSPDGHYLASVGRDDRICLSLLARGK